MSIIMVIWLKGCSKGFVDGLKNKIIAWKFLDLFFIPTLGKILINWIFLYFLNLFLVFEEKICYNYLFRWYNLKKFTLTKMKKYKIMHNLKSQIELQKDVWLCSHRTCL